MTPKESSFLSQKEKQNIQQRWKDLQQKITYYRHGYYYFQEKQSPHKNPEDGLLPLFDVDINNTPPPQHFKSQNTFHNTHANTPVYNDNLPHIFPQEISDNEFDALLRDLEDLEKHYDFLPKSSNAVGQN